MEKTNEKKDKPSRMYFTKGQIEALITCVESRRGLWDPENDEYKASRSIKLKWWQTIGDILKCDGMKCFNKWKNLMREFKIEDRSKPKAKSGDAASTYKPKFPYYDRMLFLANVQSPKVPTGSLDQLFNDNSKDIYEEYDDDFTLDLGSPSTGSAINIYSTPKDLLSGEEASLALQEKVPKHDELAYYFISMVPRLSQLSDIDTILFRGELKDIVMKYAYKNI